MKKKLALHFKCIINKLHWSMIVLFLVTALDARSQDQKAENFCQYQHQSIQKLLSNLKTAVVDTRISKTNSGKARSLLLVFNDSSYFEIFPVFNKTNSAEAFSLKNYSDYNIKCIFYQVPGDLVIPCGCKSFALSVRQCIDDYRYQARACYLKCPDYIQSGEI